ncbi:RimJ/RimL family protein N-acetyltransferase [Kribbella pratensis]|uniref:RimJ/RimL family protein N-acetyltransferase n=1 Tax=Kribbella pratensis TaxID=2512112 RepID=A0ABY2F7N3_9ACTN|nr:GNAT family N-acetyltransferase [Kribbella pratensis]TDW84378.1 RimJ/RimL family protein N-acetyltransferase [Kribbella pratensis]
MAVIAEGERLAIRGWTEADATAALEIFGSREVARWLAPEVGRVPNKATMRLLLRAWIEAGKSLVVPAGRWAIVTKADDAVVGGLMIGLLPPYEEDFEIGWQLAPAVWGPGFATEASQALMRWAFATGTIDELYAVARPQNRRACATARRLGMAWVGETDKYYGLPMQIYRLRAAELG